MPFCDFLSKTIYMVFADDKNESLSSEVDKALAVEALSGDGIVDVAIDIPPQALTAVSGEDAAISGGDLSQQSEEAQHLKATLYGALSRKMPHLFEYRHQAYHIFKPDAAVIRGVQEKLMTVRSTTAPDTLLAPAQHFLQLLLSLQQRDDPAANEIHLHAFDLMHVLSDALEAIAAANSVRHLDWEGEIAAMVDEYRHKLIAALPPNITLRQQADTLLMGESRAISAEYQRFAQLEQSLMAESLLTRQRLADRLQQQVEVILAKARDARLYAMNTLLKRTACAAVESAGHAPDHIQLLHHILHTANMLGSLAVRLIEVKERISPDEDKKEKKKAQKVWRRAEGRLINPTQGAKSAAPGQHNTPARISTKMNYSPQPACTDALDRAVRDSALLLIDEIHQAERRVKQMPMVAGEVAKAVEHYLHVSESRPGDVASLALNHLLTQELESEAKRWQSVVQQGQQQLEALIYPLTERTEDKWAEIFHGVLFKTLRDLPQSQEPGKTAQLKQIEKTIRHTAKGLSQLTQQIQAAVVRLARHGSDRLEFNTRIAQWLAALKRRKEDVRNSVFEITGRSLGSLSCRDRLVRGISEWAKGLRREYLRDFPLQEKVAAAILFDRTLLEIVQDSRRHFANKTDPQAEGFISRLKLALRHAAEETTLCSPTLQEIVAGARIVPNDIRLRAKREIISGAMLAVFREGFRLVSGPFSLPVRVMLSGVRTGLNLFRGRRNGDRLRLDEQRARPEKALPIDKVLSTVAFRLTLSLSPSIATGGAGTYFDIPQGERTKQIHTEIIKLPEALAWGAGFVGTRTMIINTLRHSIEQALKREVANFIAKVDKTSLPRRVKRASDDHHAAYGKGYYPAPERETAIDSLLENKVKETLSFTAEGAFPAPDAIQQSPVSRLYKYKRASYLFIAGRYWQFQQTDINANVLKGHIYAHTEGKSEHNPSLPVYFSEEDNKWYFSGSGDPQSSDNISSAKNSYITTKASARLIEQASEWPTESAYNYLCMAHGQQGQIYFDGVKHFIYLRDKYWPVMLRGVDEAAIVIGKATPVTIYRDAESITWDVKNKPGCKGATAALLSDVRGWNARGAYELTLSETPCEGRIYKQSHDHLYIYLAGRFWPCKKLSADLYGVFITAWGMKSVVIISDVNGYWDYADRTDTEKFYAFLDIQKKILESKIEPAVKNRIKACLDAVNFISWSNLTNQVITVIDTEFHKFYLHPENESLIAIMMLRKMILDSQKVAKEILSGTAYGRENLTWDRRLLSCYWEAFNVDITDVGALATARYARMLADDAQVKYNKLDTRIPAEEKKRLARINSNIAILKEKIWQAENNPKEYTLASHAAAFHIIYNEDFSAELKKKENEKAVVQSIVNRMQKKKDTYSQLILSYKKKYQQYEEGMALGDKTFTQRLGLQSDKSDIIAAAKEAVVELALKEVKLRQNFLLEESESERKQIDTLRIARAAVKAILVQQQVYNKLVEALEKINIAMPDASETYADIVWANRMAEALYPKLGAEEENAAARDLLPTMLHWLQKNKKSVSHLKNLRAQAIIDGYAKSRHQLNPLTTEKEIPEGYTSLSEMLGGEYFSRKWDYNQQFIEYKKKFSGYEASERVRELLIISALSLDQIAAPVKKSVRLDVRKKNNVKDVHPGELVFIQLQNNDWVFFSLFPDATFSRQFTDTQMQSNPWLKAIARLEPRKVHSHGLESTFTEAFFKKEFGHAKDKIYWDGTRRAAKEKEELINNILYKEEDGMKYPNPFEGANFGGTEYNVYEHQEQPQNSLVVTLNISMKNALNRSANKLKADLYKPSALHRIASLFIPFYSDIYGSLTDGEYKPDGYALMADIFGVVCVAAQAGAKIGSLIKNAKGIATIAREGGARGLSGRGLYKYMIRELARQGVINAVELGKISANSIFDLVDALMLRDLSGYLVSKIRSALIFHNIVPGTSAAQSVGPEFIRMDVVLKDMHKQTLRGGEVYISLDPKTRMRVYYIETANGISEVRWSQTTKAWRTVDPSDPENPGQIMHPEESKWVVSPDGTSPAVQPEMGVQNLRDDLPDRKISFNIQDAKETEGVDAQALLKELYKRDSIKIAMNNPIERSTYSMAPVGNFMLEKGFGNIRYRGIAVFINSVDKMPANHFVVIGNKNNRDYVFDLTARKFASRYDEFSGPVILPEELWAQKYANINGGSLIKYADYKSRVKAHEIFGDYSEYTSHGPQAIIPNAKVLKRPEWYYPDSLAGDSVIGRSADVAKTTVPGAMPGNKVMSSVRRSQCPPPTTDDAADYAVEVLENSELLNQETANLLRQGMKRMAEEGKAIALATDLLETPRLITSQDELLCVEKGALLLLFKAGTPPVQPYHVMVSVGNGRFAGINNSTLDEMLTNEPRILLAEQLGDFTGSQIKLNTGGEYVQIYAARPTGLILADKPALRDLASTIAAGVDSVSGLTDLLAQAGKLSPEQAQALTTALQPVVTNPAPLYGQLGAIEDVLTSPLSIKTQAELMAVPEGQLVTLMQKGKSNSGHVMFSLGDGEFVIVNPARLDASLAGKRSIIHARDIPAEVLRRNVISAGEISLQKMRVSALLGSGGAFSVEGSTLSIKITGGPAAVNGMHAQELADTIRGLAKCENYAVDLGSISEIEFYSHFGALGRVPIGKALAWYLNKKVTAYPAFYSPKLQGQEALLSQAKTFLPEDLSADEVALMIRRQSRHYEFWNHMRSLFGDKSATESVEMSSELRELLLQVADYIRGKISIDDFLDAMPHFTNGLMIMKVGLNLLYNHEEAGFDGYVSLSCDVLGASRFGAELIIHFLEK